MGHVDTLLQGFHEGRRDAAEVIRAIVEHDAWFVPLDGSGFPELKTSADQAVLDVFLNAPDRPHVRVDGRALIRGVPAGASRVVLAPGESFALHFDKDRLPELLSVAQSVDLERALLRPAPGQLRLLRDATYVVAVANDQPVVVPLDTFLVVPVFTASDAAARFLQTEPAVRAATTLERWDGDDLWTALATRDDYDGVAFDPRFREIELGGPNFADALLAGLDARHGATRLPARTIAEIHLYLDLFGAEVAGRSHQLESGPDGLTAVYQVRVGGRARAFRFAATEALPDPDHLGDGPTLVLCAGRLADALHVRLAGFDDDPARIVVADRAKAARAARWAFELEKLFVVGSDVVPRSALRTAEGARAAREHPERLTRGWVLAQRRRAEALAGTV